MSRKSKTKAHCRFEGRFPDSKTNCSFRMEIDALGAAVILAPLALSFRKAMADSYPEASIRPTLRKITVTITLP